MTVRARTSRVILLSDYAALQNPGGIIAPPAIATRKTVSSARDILWNFAEIEFPDGENLCDTNLTHTTYTGSGEWCGYFGNVLNDHGYNNRYLNLALSGTVNSLVSLEYIFYLYADAPSSWWTYSYYFLGDAAIDPTDNCSQAHNLRIESHTNGNPIVTSIVDTRFVGIDLVNTSPLDPFIINRTKYYGHPVSGDFPEDGINTPFGASSFYTPGLIQVVNDSLTKFIAPGGWAFYLGYSPGAWNTIGSVDVTLSNKHTLYDQLVLDGAEVTPTRGSRIVSIDNESGDFEATISAVTFALPDEFNVLGVEYVVKFRVRRTPDGGEPVLMEIWELYTGNGVSGETMTIEIPGAVGSLTEFVGECVSLIPSSLQGEYDNFDRLSEGQWFGPNDPIGAWDGWQSPMQFVCNDGRMSVDAFRGISVSLDEPTIISPGLNTGQCWQNGWDFFVKNDFTWDDFETKVAGETYALWPGGIGWLAIGAFIINPQEFTYDAFEDLTPGIVTTWGEGFGWRSVGGFESDQSLPNLSYDTFDELTPGALTQWGAGINWQDDGAFFT